jgi:hypothetical protein
MKNNLGELDHQEGDLLTMRANNNVELGIVNYKQHQEEQH